jgi:NAD+--dinitrogen-reductase ADP-D-ribosyltransferase
LEDSAGSTAWRGHRSNLVGVPTELLLSHQFNLQPAALHISGVRDTHAPLFARLQGLTDASYAGKMFQAYMRHAFRLDRPAIHTPASQRRFRSSYLRLLKGWGYDANSPEGAVLKGWVESRFGLIPTYHKAAITDLSCAAWTQYATEKMSSRFDNNAIYAQLDLLYEYCQWSLTQFHHSRSQHVRLYRGTNRFDENQLVARIDRHQVIVRLNNLVSFSDSRIIADEFGDYILQVEVPLAKILFFNDMLPQHPLKGEAEYLVIGGDYLATVSYL